MQAAGQVAPEGINLHAAPMAACPPDDVTDGIRSRDPDAIAACYEAFADPLYRYLWGQCQDPTLAEDLVEATFLELVEAAPSLTGGPRAVRAWLFRAARNNFIDDRRKLRRRGDVPLDERSLANRADDQAGPEEHALSAVRNATVRAALGDLSRDQREVLLLRFGAGLTGPEVAKVTGRTVGAVKALQHRGLAALARTLQSRPEDVE
jgi:RNA polymerase sigma-70 factor, ECF subfamily